MIDLESLGALNDSELPEVNHWETLLKKRDEERKAKALADVLALRTKAESDAWVPLESVVLRFKSLSEKNKGKGTKKPLI